MEEVKEKGKLPVSEDITAVYIDKGLEKLSGINFNGIIEKVTKFADLISLYGFYVAGILGFIAMIVAKFKMKAPFMTMFGIGIGFMLACLILHYLAVKFLPVVKGFLKSEPSIKFNSLLMDSMVVVFLLSTIGLLCLAIFGGNASVFFIGIIISVISLYFTILCIASEQLNIEKTDEPVKASKQFEGLIAFFMRGYLALIPVILCFGVIALNILFIRVMTVKFAFVVLPQIMTIIPLVAAPILGYFIFILYSFIMDIYTSILSLPEKLDKM